MAGRATFDVAVVGGGPAGLTAACHAARGGARTVLLDRKAKPGQKIALSGGGRCNVLPTAVDPDAYVTDSSRNAVRKIVRSWPLEEVRTFLERDVGLRLREEAGTGKLFPVSGGREVQRRLSACARRTGVELRTQALVTGIDVGAPHRLLLEGGSAVEVGRVVLATGGLSYPKTGSDGLGIEIARSLGHAIVEPYPALVALQGGPPAHHDLSGVSVDAVVTVGSGKSRVRSPGGFLFTHRGYSGPAVVNIGHLAARARHDARPLRISVSWTDRTPQEWEKRLSEGSRSVRGVVREVLPARLTACLLNELGVGDAMCRALSPAQRRCLIAALADYPLAWSGTGGFDEAEVTGGGVHLSQVDPETLCSRIVPRLHFCGEMLDAFGPIGGTNFLWAFVTGKLAGKAAAEG